MVQASAEQAERGLDILHGQRPGDRQGASPMAVPGPCGGGLPWRLHTAYRARDRGHEAWPTWRPPLSPASAGDGAGERPDYLEYEPAYRYGYDVGQRFPAQDWGTLEAGPVRAGNGGIPAPGSASRTLSGMAGTPSVAPSKPHGSCGALRRPQRLREGLPWKDQGEGRCQLSLLPPHGAQRWTQLALVKYSPQLEEAFHRRKRPVDQLAHGRDVYSRERAVVLPLSRRG